MKTALEQLADQLKQNHGIDLRLYNEFCELKEIERNHISQAYEDGEYNYFYSKKTGEDFETGIDYYNDKFKQEEQ